MSLNSGQALGRQAAMDQPASRDTMVTGDRRIPTTWERGLALESGHGKLDGDAVVGLSVTWTSHAERLNGKAGPEELGTANHVACYAMALSHALAQIGTPPTRLEVRTVASRAREDGQETVIHLEVRGQVPGLDQAGFEIAARQAGQASPIWNTLLGRRWLGAADIRVKAILVESADERPTPLRPSRRREPPLSVPTSVLAGPATVEILLPEPDDATPRIPMSPPVAQDRRRLRALMDAVRAGEWRKIAGADALIVALLAVVGILVIALVIRPILPWDTTPRPTIQEPLARGNRPPPGTGVSAVAAPAGLTLQQDVPTAAPAALSTPATPLTQPAAPTPSAGSAAAPGTPQALITPTGESTTIAPSAPSPTAVTSLRTVLDERFGDTQRSWPNSPDATAWFADGGYRLFARQPSRFVAIGAPITESLRDVVMSGTFRKVGGLPGGGYGLIVRDQGPGPRDGRNQDGRFYVLEVGDRGEVGIWRRDGDRWVELLPWTPSAAVHPGGAANELTVRALGQQLTFLVNGTEVAAREDGSPAAGGMGVFVGGDGNEALLERFTVQTPE